jgi:uncharacterized protein (DUF58 family)
MLKGKKRVSIMSSLLVMTPVIIVAFVASLLLNRIGFVSLSVFLFVVSVVGLLSRLWGLYALRRVEVALTADRETMSVGDRAHLSYTVANNKLLPVMWLELCQDVPHNDCIAPDSGFSLHRFDEIEAGVEGKAAIYRRRILFLMGMQALSWDTMWTAKRRGVYRPGQFTLRSGDGFGLTQSNQSVAAGEHVFVVWPKLVPVVTEPFFRNVWQGGTGRRGYVEDPTVLRGLRDYLPGDSWKHIDWRVAARQDDVQVRQFETILPSTVHFVLDVVSFLGFSEQNDELESAISILASLILELDRLGVRCGLSLPQGVHTPAVDMNPEDPAVTARDLLYALAALEAEDLSGGFDEAALETRSQTVGQLWLLVYSGERLSCPSLADKLMGNGLFVLCHDTGAAGILAGCPMLATGELTRGGGSK